MALMCFNKDCTVGYVYPVTHFNRSSFPGFLQTHGWRAWNLCYITNVDWWHKKWRGTTVKSLWCLSEGVSGLSCCYVLWVYHLCLFLQRGVSLMCIYNSGIWQKSQHVCRTGRAGCSVKVISLAVLACLVSTVNVCIRVSKMCTQ